MLDQFQYGSLICDIPPLQDLITMEDKGAFALHTSCVNALVREALMHIDI